MTRLEVVGVNAGYGSMTVLHDVSVSVETGQTTVVLGANGAGKTTLLRAISGTARRTGTIMLDGVSISSLSPDAIVRRGIAHVPQGRGTFGRLTVEENLAVAGSLRPRRDVARESSRIFDQFPVLGDRRRQVAAGLSGGEQQMLAIGRALMLAPRVLLLDEPSLGLAPKITGQVFDLIGALCSSGEIAVVVVEQNAELSMALADYVVVLEGGRIAASGTPDQLASSDAIRRAYLGAEGDKAWTS
jgi:branched-chain amino acid transport system ATP-binding protein